MPGTDLNLDLPDLEDQFAVIVSKLVTALAAIEDDLAEKVVPAEFNVNTAMSFNGNALTNVGSLKMVMGNPSDVPGTLYYQDGEWYMVDSTGVIQVTSNGALKVTGTGGIGGDYGSGNEELYYDVSTQTYHFTSSPGVYGDVKADDVVLTGSAGTLRLQVDAALTGDRVFSFKTLNSSGTHFLVYNATTSTVETLASTTAGDETLKVFLPAESRTGWTYVSVGTGLPAGYPALRSAAGGATLWTYGIPLSTKRRVKSVDLTVNRGTSTGTPTQVTVYLRSLSIIGEVITLDSETFDISGGGASVAVSLTNTTHTQRACWVEVSVPKNGLELVGTMTIIHDEP
jgi:hypothetical protein